MLLLLQLPYTHVFVTASNAVDPAHAFALVSQLFRLKLLESFDTPNEIERHFSLCLE